MVGRTGHLYSLHSLYALEGWKPLAGNNLRVCVGGVLRALVSPCEVVGQDHADFSSSGDAKAAPEGAPGLLPVGEELGWVNSAFASFPAAALS